MLNRDRRGRRQRPIANFRGSGPTPLFRRDAQGGHPMGPDDPTWRALLHRARRRARRYFIPKGSIIMANIGCVLQSVTQR